MAVCCIEIVWKFRCWHRGYCLCPCLQYSTVQYSTVQYSGFANRYKLSHIQRKDCNLFRKCWCKARLVNLRIWRNAQRIWSMVVDDFNCERIYLVIYLVWPHQSCWSTCAAIGLVGHQSSKKPIRDCISRCRPFLKLFTVLAFTVWWSKLFHLLTSRSVKKCHLTSNLLLCLCTDSVRTRLIV